MTPDDLEIQTLRRSLAEARKTILFILKHPKEACKVCERRDDECKRDDPSCEPVLKETTYGR